MSHLNFIADKIVELPSKGLPYDTFKVPLITGNCVGIQPMAWREMRRLVSASDSYRMLQGLFTKVVVDPVAPAQYFDELLLSDVTAVMYAMRIITQGPDYNYEFKCHKCEVPVKKALSLYSAEIWNADDIPSFRADGLEFDVAGHTVVLHLSRMKDEKEIVRQTKLLMTDKVIDGNSLDAKTVTLAQLIDSIDDTEYKDPREFLKKFNFLDSLPPVAIRDLMKKVNDADVGIKTKQHLECEKCGHLHEVNLEMGKEFFRFE